MEDRFLKIKTEPSGLTVFPVCQGFALWEADDDETETIAKNIVVDVACGPRIEYKDIPAIVEYLEYVYQIRVTEGRVQLNKCEKCHQIIGRE